MGAVQKKNWKIPQGTTWRMRIVYGADLTGWTPRMQMRETVDATNVVFDTAEGDGDFVMVEDTPEVGQTELTLTVAAAITGAFNFEEAVYDIEVYLVDEVIRILQGAIVVNKEVTR